MKKPHLSCLLSILYPFQVRGIENIHEFHIWQLSGNKIIATAHIRFHNIYDYMQAFKEMESILHDEGIHSTTIQPEFSEVSSFHMHSTFAIIKKRSNTLFITAGAISNFYWSLMASL